MSRGDDRIPVPTNGHRPPLDTAAPDRPDLRIAVTPAQAAVGFGVIASLVLLLLGARRRRR